MMRWLTGVALAFSAIALVACKASDIGNPRPGTVFVAARDSFFTPDTIHVAVGKAVRWTNQGHVYHSVVSDGALWGSDLLRPAWWFEVRFDSAGTFPYHCSQHAAMTGTVVVDP